MSDDKALTIFDVGEKERAAAFEIFLSGRTPKDEIRSRPGRGGTSQSYVNTYYMTRLFNLITGFRWTSECLEEKYRPDAENPIEVLVKIKVTTWDRNGCEISHVAWGTKDIARYESSKYKVVKGKLQLDPKTQKPIEIIKAGDIIALGDDLKSAYSDGIKKCLSYFGIADDIYGGKEAEPYIESGEGQAGSGVSAPPLTPGPLAAVEEVT